MVAMATTETAPCATASRCYTWVPRFIKTALVLAPRLPRPTHHLLPQTRPQAKALTIGKLMEIAPGGTMDPTPFIYDSTMYTMAGLMVR